MSQCKCCSRFFGMERKRKYMADYDGIGNIARKRTLNSLLNAGIDELTHYSIIDNIVNMSEETTKITNLASYIFLYRVDDATDMLMNDDRTQFFESIGTEIISLCFKAVLNQNKDSKGSSSISIMGTSF